MRNNLKEFDESIITVDTPVPFKSADLKSYLELKNTEEIETGEVYQTGANKGEVKTRQGTYFNKLTNLINRLQSKIDDKKYAFIFAEEGTSSHTYLNCFANEILDYSTKNNIKIIDLSEVPSDILPIIIGTLTRLIYDIQFG